MISGVAEKSRSGGADLANAAWPPPKRPDVVLYVNGIALGVLGSKRSHRVGVRRHPAEPGQPEEGIHTALLQHHAVVMAGNDTEGLRYATTETPRNTGCSG